MQMGGFSQALFHDKVDKNLAVVGFALLLHHPIAPLLKKGPGGDGSLGADRREGKLPGFAFDPTGQSGGDPLALEVLVDKQPVEVPVRGQVGKSGDRPSRHSNDCVVCSQGLGPAVPVRLLGGPGIQLAGE